MQTVRSAPVAAYRLPDLPLAGSGESCNFSRGEAVRASANVRIPEAARVRSVTKLGDG